MESGWDSDVKIFFVKIMNTIAWGLIWLLATATAGLYFELGYPAGKPVIYTVIFYVCAVATLFLLLRYFYKRWKD